MNPISHRKIQEIADFPEAKTLLDNMCNVLEYLRENYSVQRSN